MKQTVNQLFTFNFLCQTWYFWLFFLHRCWFNWKQENQEQLRQSNFWWTKGFFSKTHFAQKVVKTDKCKNGECCRLSLQPWVCRCPRGTPHRMCIVTPKAGDWAWERWRFAQTKGGKMLPPDIPWLTGKFYVVNFNKSAVTTSLAISHATLNDSLLILQFVVQSGGGGRDDVWDQETMFPQLAKRSPYVVVSG